MIAGIYVIKRREAWFLRIYRVCTTKDKGEKKNKQLKEMIKFLFFHLVARDDK